MRHLDLEMLNSRKGEISQNEYLRARHAVTEIQRVKDAVIALRASDFEVLGRLINQSHDSLRDDYTVSCPELDVAVDISREVGALGARMVGGGFGGSAIALIKADQLSAAKSAIKQAYADHGFKAPRFFSSLPSAGASATLSR
jgi:galactokinase